METVYNFVMNKIEYFALMMADLLNQAAVWLAAVDLPVSALNALGMVYGLFQLAIDATVLFPDYFRMTLLALVASFFLSMIIRALITLWRVVPFT